MVQIKNEIYNPVDYLRHIQDHVDFLMKISKEHDSIFIVEDETLSRAVLRSLRVIEQATLRIDSSFKEKNKEIPWNELTAFKNVLGLDVDYNRVRSIIENDIPELEIKIDKLLN